MNLPRRIPPLVFVLVVNLYHVGNITFVIGVTMYIVEAFAASDFQVGLIGAITFFSYGAMAWLGGLLADRFPRRALMTVGLLLLTVCFSFVPWAPSLGAIYLLAGLIAGVQMLVMPSHFGLISESVRPGRVSRILGINGSCLVMAGMIAGFSVGHLLEHFGPRATFSFAGALSLIVAVFAALFTPHPEGETRAFDPDRTAPEPDAAPPVGHPEARAFMILAVMLNFSGFFFAMTHQMLLVRVATLPAFDLSLGEQSNIQGLRLMAAMTGYFLAGVLTFWHWRRAPFALAAAYMIAISAAAAWSPNAWVLGGAICLGGFATSFCNQMSLFYCVTGGVVGRGRGAGITESALALGGGTGPLLGGWLAEQVGTPRAALFLPIVPLTMCLIVLAVFRAKKKV